MSEASGSQPAQNDEATPAPANAQRPFVWPFGKVVSLLIAAVVVGVLLASGKVTTFFVVASLVAMVMIHELGHFATAKWSGMKVTEYFLGFGPTLWSLRRGETEYGVKALPLGGYVKIIGMSNLEEVAPEDEPGTYRQQRFWKRLMVASAGSFMHFVMAYLILVAVFAGVGTPVPSTTVGAVSQPRNGQSPAQVAGLQPGDKILSVDGRPVSKWEEIPAAVRDRVGQAVPFAIERNGQRMELAITPVDRAALDLGVPVPAAATPVGFVGIGPKQSNETIGLAAALSKSARTFGTASVDVVKSIGKVFSPSGLQAYYRQVKGDTDSSSPEAAETRFVSPVGLVNYANAAAESGTLAVLGLLFSVNIFVGIFNLIPLLPFDGGHIAVACYERVRSIGGRRHRVDFAKLLPVSYAVILVLALIALSSLWLDIVNPAPSPW